MPTKPVPRSSSVPGSGTGVAVDSLKPTKGSGPSFDGRQLAGAPAGQPSCDESPAKKPDEPAIATIVLNCVCSAALSMKLNTALPFPCCRARSAAEKVSGTGDSEKLPTEVVPLKIVSVRLC